MDKHNEKNDPSGLHFEEKVQVLTIFLLGIPVVMAIIGESCIGISTLADKLIFCGGIIPGIRNKP